MSENPRFNTDPHRSVNARRIADETWEKYKDVILQLYQGENRPIDEIRRLMEERHNFTATSRQYIHHLTSKWGVKKYKQKSANPLSSAKSLSTRSPSAGQLSSEDHPFSEYRPPLEDFIPREQRSRSNSPLIETPGRPNPSSKRLLQPTVEDVEDDGDIESPGLSGFDKSASQEASISQIKEKTVTQPAVAPSASPSQTSERLSPANLETNLPAGDVRTPSRHVDNQTVRQSVILPPVILPASQGFIPDMIRSVSKDTDLGQAFRHPDKLSCPYRKRNPLRFNVRDYQSCASQSYPDISQLKRHVKVFHKRRKLERCPRCKEGFGSKQDVERHFLVPSNQICDVKALPPPDPEDGINDAIEDCLNGRKANTKIDSWESLWYLLFPDDAQPADPDYYQVKEHFELERYLLQQIPESENELRHRLLAMIKTFYLTNPPHAGTNTSQNQEAAAPLRSLTPGPKHTTVPSAGITPKRRRTTDDDPE